MTLTFSCMLGIIFIFEIGAAVAAYHLRAQVEKLLEDCVFCPETFRN